MGSSSFIYNVVGMSAEVTCWMVTGERQAARIRRLYLKAILRQDVTFFDLQTNTGEVVARMSGDTIVIQDATGEQVHTTYNNINLANTTTRMNETKELRTLSLNH